MEQDQGNIYVSQRGYLEKRLEKIHIEQAGLYKAKTKLTEDSKAKLRQLIGKIRWVSDQSSTVFVRGAGRGFGHEEVDIGHDKD